MYATQSDTLAGNTVGVANSENYYDGTNYLNGDSVGSGTHYLPTRNALTDVGAYGASSASFYGTNDQGGNVFEWNDAVYLNQKRGTRGGSWDLDSLYQRSIYRSVSDPSSEGVKTGFRIATVPEPGVPVLVLLAGGVALLTRRKR